MIILKYFQHMIILLIIDRYDSVMWGLCLDAKQESV